MFRRRKIAFALILGLVLGAASCGNDESAPVDETAEAPNDGDAADEDVSAPDDGEPQTVTVGVVPFTTLAPFYLSQQEGFFEDQGIQIETTTSHGGADLVAALLSGDIDIAYSNHMSSIQAVAEGFELRFVRENDRGSHQDVYALPDGPIQNPEDLVGRTVGVNTLDNVQHITTLAALEEYGIDSTGVEFTEVAPPDMPAALEAGRVDAVWVAEPFLTIVEMEFDAVPVLNLFEDALVDFPVAGWISSQAFAENQPDLLAGFSRALDQGHELAADDETAAIAIIEDFTEVPEALLDQLNVPEWAVDSDPDRLQEVLHVMADFDLVQPDVDLSAFLQSVD